VSWLGVTMYLTRDAISRALTAISNFAPGTELITDHILPASLRDAAADSYAELVGAAAAECGEPWLTFLSPGEASELLAAHGLEPAEQVHQRDAIDAALWRRSDSLRPTELSMLVRAKVAPDPAHEPTCRGEGHPWADPRSRTNGHIFLDCEGQ